MIKKNSGKSSSQVWTMQISGFVSNKNANCHIREAGDGEKFAVFVLIKKTMYRLHYSNLMTIIIDFISTFICTFCP